MQVSDFVNQYHNVSGSSSNITGVEQYSNSTSMLKTGQIFEGSVNSVKDGQVVIGLSSGQTLNARLDNGVNLLEGSSLFFQVKSNEGGLIQIRPVPQMELSNPTLLNALDAAGVVTNEKSLAMVNTMMKNQMPIDSDSVISMNRAVLSHQDISPQTVVSLAKYSIPITNENAAMYENYIADKAQISTSINSVTNSLPQLLVNDSLSVNDAINLNNSVVNLFSNNDAGIEFTSDVVKMNVSAENYSMEISTTEAVSEGIASAEQLQTSVGNTETFNISTLGTVLSDKAIVSFGNVLTNIPGFSSAEQHLFNSDGSLRQEVTPREMLNAISDFANSSSDISKDTIKNLFSHNAYSKLISSVIEDDWTLYPSQVSKPEEIGKLYERILRQTNDLEQLINNTNLEGKEIGAIKNSLNEIKNNVSFMDQMNNIYNFVQIPLKINSQMENGELYVYKNNKGNNSESDELSAFLHFDLPSLGSTDISVKLLHKNVTCNWYLEKEDSLALIEKNIDVLEKKLQDLGYNCKFGFEAEKKSFNLENTLLNNKDSSAPKQLVHRYSFDVRA